MYDIAHLTVEAVEQAQWTSISYEICRLHLRTGL